jgi:A/G-specific adenine glycosylase
LEFSEKIIKWYRQNKRNLPWRTTKNPYKIWLSEIILQQTQVKQGLPYYEKFVSSYPNVQALANAHEDDVLKLWQGLGYYSRARNLHYTAKYITKDLQAEFPETFKELLKLKGVGEYTAAAIASFAYNEAVPVVDGNVYRVLSRFFGIDTPINSPEGVTLFKQKAQEVFDFQNPAEHNQAIMEFGALMCKPKSPDCMFCPLQIECVAYQSGKVNDLPVKLKKLKRRKRYFNYLIIKNLANEIIIQQRKAKDIWQKLFQFPLLESKSQRFQLEVEELNTSLESNFDSNLAITKINETPYKHVLSHQDIFADFWLVNYNFDNSTFEKGTYISTSVEDLKKYAVPILIDNFMKEHFNET